MSGAALRIRGLAAGCLSGIDLDVAAGSIVCVCGPSGAGKSTLLKAVAGLQPPVHGEVWLGERDLLGVPVYARGLGYVDQDLHLFPHLSLLDNVRLGLRRLHLGRRQEHEAAAHWLQRVGLGALLARRPVQVSGGERQRAALARALAGRPALLLLDEPFSDLDLETGNSVRDLLLALQRELGLATLLVTHQAEDRARLADRVLWLRDGRLREDAPPQSGSAGSATASMTSSGSIDTHTAVPAAGGRGASTQPVA